MLTSDRTGKSWPVDYTITHTTDIVTIRGADLPHRTSVVAIRSTANLQPGQYTLQTNGEIFPLEQVNGRWEIREPYAAHYHGQFRNQVGS
jgi:hypothetical protein